MGFTSQPTGLKGFAAAGDRDHSTHDGSTGVLFLVAKVGPVEYQTGGHRVMSD